MAITEFDRMVPRRRLSADQPHKAEPHGFDGKTVGAVLLCGWVWGVFVFLGWGLLHAAHFSVG